MPPLADLLAAIRSRDAVQVEKILAAEPALALTREAGQPSPLLMAAYLRAPDLVALLTRRAAMDACEAAALGDTERLAEVLGRDPSQVNARSGDGWTPLHLAAYFGSRAAVELLLSRGASVSAVSGGQEKNQPLHAALAGACDPPIVKALVARGADVNATGAGGVTPLHVAASRGSAELVRLLVAAGADTEARLQDGKTPAAIATERGHPEIAALIETLA